MILFSLGNHGNQSESLSVLGLGFFTCALEEVMDMLAEVSLLILALNAGSRAQQTLKYHPPPLNEPTDPDIVWLC